MFCLLIKKRKKSFHLFLLFGFHLEQKKKTLPQLICLRVCVCVLWLFVRVCAVVDALFLSLSFCYCIRSREQSPNGVRLLFSRTALARRCACAPRLLLLFINKNFVNILRALLSAVCVCAFLLLRIVSIVISACLCVHLSEKESVCECVCVCVTCLLRCALLCLHANRREGKQRAFVVVVAIVFVLVFFLSAAAAGWRWRGGKAFSLFLCWCFDCFFFSFDTEKVGVRCVRKTEENSQTKGKHKISSFCVHAY